MVVEGPSCCCCWLWASMMGPCPLSPITITDHRSQENHMLVILIPSYRQHVDLSCRPVHCTSYIAPIIVGTFFAQFCANDVKCKHEPGGLPTLGKAPILTQMGNDSPISFRGSVEWFGKETFIGVGQSSFQNHCSSISFSFCITEFLLPEEVPMRLDRGLGVYWGAAELDGGWFGGGLEGTKHQGGGGDRPEGPEDTRPGTPKLPQSSSITFFNSKDLFAGRKGTPKGYHVCGKDQNPKRTLGLGPPMGEKKEI